MRNTVWDLPRKVKHLSKVISDKTSYMLDEIESKTVHKDEEDCSLLNPYANAFVFGDFNIHHEDWLTYSGRTDRPG